MCEDDANRQQVGSIDRLDISWDGGPCDRFRSKAARISTSRFCWTGTFDEMPIRLPFEKVGLRTRLCGQRSLDTLTVTVVANYQSSERFL